MTICFADLDGADGLWVPEERTILVNRRLPEDEVAHVIEHELGHVAIDDGHAALDAGVGPPAGRSRRWVAPLAAAAACMAMIGGLSAGLAGQQEGRVQTDPVVLPSQPPLTGDASPVPVGPAPTVLEPVGRHGDAVYRTVTPPAATGPPAGTRADPTPSSRPSPSRSPGASSTPPPGTSAPTSTAPPTQFPSPTPDPTVSVDPTTPPATSSAPAP